MTLDFEREGSRTMLALYGAAAESARHQGNFGAAQIHLKAASAARKALGEKSASPRYQAPSSHLA